MTFRLGLSRDVLDAAGEPSFGREALSVLDANPNLQWEFIPEDIREVTPEIAARYDGLYVNSPKVTRGSVARSDCRLRIVARHGVGYDSVDVGALTEGGILLTNTPDAVRRPMAISALTLIFALSGRLLMKDRLVRENRWNERTSHMGVGLTTRTLGIIGAGGIGQELLELARPFFGKMLAADPFVDSALVRGLGADVVPLDMLVSQADFVVVCCLLNEKTYHLIDADRLKRMKPTSFLINVARGPVVDEAALIAALSNGDIAGCGLDVFEEEPIASGNPLTRMKNVVLTPHALGWTDECFHDIAATGLQSVVDVSLGRVPAFVVNPQVFQAAFGVAEIREKRSQGSIPPR
jgi:phosphoglycerate dehydrogenase-like enzyme